MMDTISAGNTIAIGDTTLTRIIERDGPWHDPYEMFPEATPEKVTAHLAQLPAFAYDPAVQKICMTFQSFLLRTPQHTILMDTCVGQHEERRANLLYPKDRWLAEFKAAGVSFEDIDYVFCTHLHVDHVGWNTQLKDGRWVPTFPNAKYIFGRTEFDFWDAWTKEHGAPSSGPSFQDSVLPIVEAGRAVLVDDDFQLNDLIHLSPAPGHTPGQCCANLSSNGAHAIFAGDALHHPLQVFEPDWSTVKCEDRALAITSRREILERCVDTDTLLIPAHFPGTTAGHVIARGDNYAFRYLPE
ncbi:MAG: MBL fold metallo-hydrolase [Rhodospirillaceae bacterium]|jgi:glyoxylase-like metal-dependent hydrolase (beta-lactamase superfamily II)|nr:MBL fold metallo-hydrolase [Rhodospirillaceae bacterium]